MMFCPAILLLVLATVTAHDGLPINQMLGVPGFPDCIQTDFNAPNPELTLNCFVNKGPGLRIGTIGDSITAGVGSSNSSMAYPGQLQTLLSDTATVTNLGACGSTMMKGANSPYWKRPQYTTLTNGTWDIVTIMLGTNDAKDAASGGPPNWPHDCTGPRALACAYAVDYAAMVDLVKTLGPDSKSPKIYAVVPPPLMQKRSIGANQTVINTVFPQLIRQIAEANNLDGVIDVFDAMGGTYWPNSFPDGCTLDNPDDAKCSGYCDQQWCDQCHPNNVGYSVIAATIKKGLDL